MTPEEANQISDEQLEDPKAIRKHYKINIIDKYIVNKCLHLFTILFFMLDRRAFLINKHFDDCVTIIEVQPYDSFMTALVGLRYGTGKSIIDWGDRNKGYNYK